MKGFNCQLLTGVKYLLIYFTGQQHNNSRMNLHNLQDNRYIAISVLQVYYILHYTIMY